LVKIKTNAQHVFCAIAEFALAILFLWGISWWL